MDDTRTRRRQYRVTSVGALLLAVAVSGSASASASVPTPDTGEAASQAAAASPTEELAAAQRVALERAAVARAATVRAEQLDAQADQAASARHAAEVAAASGRSRAAAATKVRVDLARGLVQARSAVQQSKTSRARRTNTERVRVLQRRYDAAVKAEQAAVSGARALSISVQRRAQAVAGAKAKAAAAWQDAGVAQERADEASELVRQIERSQGVPVAPRPDPAPAPTPDLDPERTPPTAPAPPARAPAPAAGLADYEAAVLHLTNVERVKAGLTTLKPSRCASDYARAWSSELASTDQFRHGDIGQLFDLCKEPTAFLGLIAENIAMGWSDLTPAETVDMWMRSPGHRANILEAGHTHLGVGAARAADGKFYATQNFLAYR